MVLLRNTNIIIDGFNTHKPKNSHIYILTHMHSDHYKGLTPIWDHGTIYCSEITKILLQNIYPQILNIKSLPLNKPQLINSQKDSDKNNVQVTFFDANHCPGSIMVLIQGYMGTILHTGDMRFDQKFYENKLLYKSKNDRMEGVGIPIDELYLDNTFCDPIFQFPYRETVQRQIINLITTERHNYDRVVLSTDSLGKEDILIALAKEFDTRIWVAPIRYKNLLSIDLSPECFTTERNDSWIWVVNKKERDQLKLEKVNLVITLTGWANKTNYECQSQNCYILPYSLHSNFSEIEQFVRSIRPCKLTPLCHRKVYNTEEEDIHCSQIAQLMRMKQTGMEILDQYTQPENFSKAFRDNESAKPRDFVSVEQKLKENTTLFQQKYQNVFKKAKRPGIQFQNFENNQNLSQEQLDFLALVNKKIKL